MSFLLNSRYYLQGFFVLLFAFGIGGMEGKAFYENVTPDGAHHVQPFDKELYVSWLDLEVDTNLVVAVTAFLITILLLAINSIYPLSKIRLPLLDSSSRDSRHIDIPDNLDHLSDKIASPSRPAYLDHHAS